MLRGKYAKRTIDGKGIVALPSPAVEAKMEKQAEKKAEAQDEAEKASQRKKLFSAWSRL